MRIEWEAFCIYPGGSALNQGNDSKKKDPKDIGKEKNTRFGVKKILNARNKEKMVGLLRHLLDSSCNYKDICFLLNLGDGLISQDTEILPPLWLAGETV